VQGGTFSPMNETVENAGQMERTGETPAPLPA
jgi:hypothetical protein